MIPPKLKSSIYLNFKIDQQSVQDTFNTIIDDNLEAEIFMSFLGTDVKVKKFNKAKIEIFEKEIITTLSLQINANKTGFLKSLNANGILETTFRTLYNVSPDWTIFTETVLENHRWIEKPRLSFGGLKMSVTGLANAVINKSKTKLEEQIDNSIKDQLNLPPLMMDVTRTLNQPIEIDSLIQSWLYIQLDTISLNKLEGNDRYLNGIIELTGEAMIESQGSRSENHINQLPIYKLKQDSTTQSQVNLLFDLEYEYLNESLNEKYKGKRFESESKYFIVKDINVSRKNDQLCILLDVEGTIDGQLQIYADPRYDKENQLFYPDNLKVKFLTKNIIQKAATWILKSKIKKELVDLSTISMSETMDSLKLKIDSQLKLLNQDNSFDLEIRIVDLEINKIVLDNRSIHSFIGIDFHISAEIKDLSAFEFPKID